MENLVIKLNQNITMEDEILNSVCGFINFSLPEFSETELKACVKEACVAKLCAVIGIRGFYNHKSDFFNFFSSVVGEALMQILGYNIHFADEKLRFFSFDHVNLVETTKYIMLNENKDEAFIDAFNLVDKFKYLIPSLKDNLNR